MGFLRMILSCCMPKEDKEAKRAKKAMKAERKAAKKGQKMAKQAIKANMESRKPEMQSRKPEMRENKGKQHVATRIVHLEKKAEEKGKTAKMPQASRAVKADQSKNVPMHAPPPPKRAPVPVKRDPVALDVPVPEKPRHFTEHYYQKRGSERDCFHHYPTQEPLQGYQKYAYIEWKERQLKRSGRRRDATSEPFGDRGKDHAWHISRRAYKKRKAMEQFSL